MNVVYRTLFAALAFAALSPAAYAETVTPDKRVKRSVIIRQEPTTDSAPIGRLRIGETLELASDQSGWYEVKLADGRRGFVSKAWTNSVDQSFTESLIDAGGSFKVHIIDVGTGLAVYIEGRDFAMLYDAGSQDDLANGNDNRVVSYIKAVSPNLNTINHLVLSHPHKDHVQLMPDVFDQYVVKNVWDSGAVNLTVGYCNFLKKVAAEPSVKYHNAINSGQLHTVECKKGAVSIREAGQMSASPVILGQNATMTILYRDASKHPDPNENTVVVRLDLGQKRILLAGDSEGGERRLPASQPDANSIEAKLLDCCKTDLKADALIVGHHGSLSSSRSSFIDAVGASVFVISSGPHAYGKNRIVLPDEEIVLGLEARGRVLRTDIDDAECAVSDSKVGPDSDESPGGCSNVVITVRGSEMTAEYGVTHD